jgi:RNA 2',3'-cyclic 3'-phosphodiesterase
VRLFVALDLPDDVRRAIGESVERLKPVCRDARWMRTENMHVTVKFIGHVPDGDAQGVDGIRAALAGIHSDQTVEMRFRGTGFFPNERRPRVFWCGIEASPNLAQLAGEMDRALEPQGVPIEKRPYVPHLTLARLDAADESVHSAAEMKRLVQEAEKLKNFDFGAARETEFHLFESILKRSGAEYKKLESYRFVKEPS